MSCSRHPSANSDGSSTCTSVKVQLHRPLSELKLLITAGENRPTLMSASEACSTEASLHNSYDVPEMGPCAFAADLASGKLAVEEHWLRIDSACPQTYISVQVWRAQMLSSGID